MSVNSTIEPVPAAQPKGAAEPLFFPVSVPKLIVLSTFTFGIYQFYWFYKNWHLIAKREKSDISPFWRTCFGYFYCHTLFIQVRQQQARLEGSQPLQQPLPAVPLAAGWIIANLVWILPDPWWLLSFSAVLFMVPVQRVVERINAVVAPNHDRNARFTAGNWAAIAIGGLVLVLLAAALTLTHNSFEM
jgi:Domain of unknown function (DUF4234)